MEDERETPVDELEAAEDQDDEQLGDAVPIEHTVYTKR